ncbi:MAG: hypothetical protein ACRBN8_01590 [Nannocystales bacterium]
MMRRLLVLLMSVVGCGPAPHTAVVPVYGDSTDEVMTLEGTIEEIHFQNINKARGHYTYNVELRVAHEGIPGPRPGQTNEPGQFRVRVLDVGNWGGALGAPLRGRATDP